MTKIPAWSFSSLKTFTTCPKKFYHTKVLKDIKEPEGEQALYGKLVHEVAELYIRDGKEIPEKFAFIKPALDSLLKIQGEKFCELKMALTEKLEPCDFFDPDCWFRGVADLLIIDREKGEARVFVPTMFEVEQQHRYWGNWMPKVMMLEGAYSADIWNAKPNGLCKNYCWVSSCAHCGRK
jgi:hypothetical protein